MPVSIWLLPLPKWLTHVDSGDHCVCGGSGLCCLLKLIGDHLWGPDPLSAFSKPTYRVCRRSSSALYALTLYFILCSLWPCFKLASIHLCQLAAILCRFEYLCVMSLPCMLYYRVLSVLNCQGTTDANQLKARILCGVSNCDLGFKWLCKYNSHGYTCYTRRTFVNRRPRCIQWNKKWKVCYTKLGFKGYRT